MKRLLLAGVFLTTLVAGVSAAEKFEAKSVHLAAEAPDGFIKPAELPKADEFIGEAKAIFVSTDAANNAGTMLVHHMTNQAGDFNGFKQAFEPLIEKAFSNGFKLIKQEDVKVGKLDGFELEFACPGDGTKPDPNGNIPHHIRWYFFKDGDAKVIGVVYGAREAAWKDLDPKFAASFKTFKYVE